MTGRDFRRFAAGLAMMSLAAAGVSGCAQGNGSWNKQNTGTALGAVAGAAAGAAIGGSDDWWWAAGLGALAGGVIGNQVGAYLDRQDQETSYRNATYALDNVPDGQAARWSNPEKNTAGYTKPVETVQTASGQTCRTFQTGVTAQGESSSGTGTACRQADGTWKIMR